MVRQLFQGRESHQRLVLVAIHVLAYVRECGNPIIELREFGVVGLDRREQVEGEIIENVKHSHICNSHGVPGKILVVTCNNTKSGQGLKHCLN